MRTRTFIALCALVFASGCVRNATTSPQPPALPAALRGDFVDDYGIRYSISPGLWFQRPQARYHVDLADTTAGYLIARNDDGNPGDKGLWTRIDWVRLTNMAPFEWAFCLSAYKELTREAAQAVTGAKKETPRTGCGGYPFSRMRRATPADTLKSKPYLSPGSRP